MDCQRIGRGPWFLFNLMFLTACCQPCLNTCQPFRPCGAIGCPNLQPPPNFWRSYPGPRSWRGPNPPPRGAHRQEEAYWSDNNVRMGVGYSSARDLNMTIHTDGVIRGPESVHLGAGNYACRDLRAQVYGNVVDSTDDLSIGVGNVSGRDSDLFVHDNDLRGRYGSVNVGVGNQSGGGIRIVVAGNRWGETPHRENGPMGGFSDASRRHGHQ